MKPRSFARSAELFIIACLFIAAILAARADAAPATAAEPAADPDRFAAELEVHFAGPELSRTVMQAGLRVDPTSLRVNDHGYYNVGLSGEVLVDGRRYDRFRYRFDVADDGDRGRPIMLVFERTLRPGEYELALTVDDLFAQRSFSTTRPLVVPRLAGDAGTDGHAVGSAEDEDPLWVQPTIDLLPPASPILIGMQRFVARTTGDVDAVTFFLDDRAVLTTRRAPFTVELDLGEAARVRTLRADALGPDGRVLASDRRELNTGGQRFAVALETRNTLRSWRDVVATATVEVPKGREVERVELFLGDDRLAVLDEAPYELTLERPREEPPPLLRAVAHLDDGRVAEAVTVPVGRGEVDDVQVEMVELFPAIVDRKGRPVEDLARGDFAIYENSIEQTIARFERVDGLPIHAALVVDTSSSMVHRLDSVATAADEFFRIALEPQDRAMLVTFNQSPRTVVDFTADRGLLANAVIGLEASGTTALYDSLIHALERFDGLRGQRALLLLSDGQDEVSRNGLQEVMELARRTGVTIYTIGLETRAYEAMDREVLHRLAGETGGRSFLVDDVSELGRIYAQIQKDLRSRYFIAYQSTNSEDVESFRVVDIQVARPGLQARAARGYYP